MPVQYPPPLSDPALLGDIAEISRIKAVPRILETVAHITGSRFTAIARVTETTWTACATYDTLGFGLVPGGQLVLETTLCNEIRQSATAVVFAHASRHPQYAEHHTPRIYGLESYASVPIFRPDGRFFGTLCAIDPAPANFDVAHVQRSMELLAELVGNYLDTEERLEQAATELSDAHQVAELRDQFIAVLGHDLRNPIQSIAIVTETLEAEPHTERQQRLFGHIASSVARMEGLVGDVLDFARGRLGGGIPVALSATDDLGMTLQHVVNEVAHATGRADIAVQMQLACSVQCDPQRLAQLLANLLTNAAQHGDKAVPIRLEVQADPHALLLSVRNGGQIPAEQLASIFRPFSREKAEQPRPGLGLGLYIAAEIARSHGGSLTVASDASSGTVFVFRMPNAVG